MDVRFNGRAVQGHRSTSGSFTAGKPGKPRRQRMNRDGAAREGARQGRAIVQRTYMVCPSKPLLGWADGERGRSCRKCSLPRPCRPTSSHIVPVVPGTTNKFFGGGGLMEKRKRHEAPYRVGRRRWDSSSCDASTSTSTSTFTSALVSTCNRVSWWREGRSDVVVKVARPAPSTIHHHHQQLIGELRRCKRAGDSRCKVGSREFWRGNYGI